MRIITNTCKICGTVVAANELERQRVMKCPGVLCDEVIRFNNLSVEEREFFLKHVENYQI